MRTLYIQTTAR